MRMSFPFIVLGRGRFPCFATEILLVDYSSDFVINLLPSVSDRTAPLRAHFSNFRRAKSPTVTLTIRESLESLAVSPGFGQGPLARGHGASPMAFGI